MAEDSKYEDLWKKAVGPRDETAQKSETKTVRYENHVNVPRAFINSVALVLIAIVLIVVGFALKAQVDQNKLIYTAEVSGVVLSGAHETSSHGRHGTKYRCTFDVQYSVQNFVPVTVSGSESGHCGADESAGVVKTVYYDPANPSNATVTNPKGFGAFTTSLGLWAFAGLFGTIGVVKFVRTRRLIKS